MSKTVNISMTLTLTGPDGEKVVYDENFEGVSVSDHSIGILKAHPHSVEVLIDGSPDRPKVAIFR